jgi:hypothetical protein
MAPVEINHQAMCRGKARHAAIVGARASIVMFRPLPSWFASATCTRILV